jgi:BlaI family transcriptional regulator, penicillinase repressor
MTDGHRLSDLQLAIMRVLWARVEATVAQVHADLYEERRLAPTTIATVLSRLEKKNLVDHRADGRQFVYRAQVSEQTVRKTMVSELTDLLFAGDVTELMSHLLAGREVDTDDLARVRRLIDKKERESEGDADDSH